MSSSEPPPSTGLIAGKYELLGMIGRGGMGSVWEGRHASLGTRVAIKFIEAEYANSQEARSRFDNEARAAATIQSKHAIQIFDHGVTHDGKPYIVMELLIGEPLDKRIERLGRLTLQDTARILQQVCRGLQRAHERGIVHRDLKPENVFLVRTEEDDEEIAKVLDFGIAKIKSPDGMGISSSTKTGAVLGTPFFMSPEQARGLRGVDHRSDVWSIGVIAFKCITGVLPFDGESVGDLLVKICTAPPPVPSHLVQGLPPSFDAWFARALDREPDRRFASATEQSDALAYAAGISVRRALGQSTPEPYAAGYLPTLPDGQVLSRPMSTPGPRGLTPHVPHSGPPSMGAGPVSQLPSATAAPFTQSTPAGVPRGGRGLVVLSSIFVFVFLGGGGFYVVTRLTRDGGTVGAGTVEKPNDKPGVIVAASNGSSTSTSPEPRVSPSGSAPAPNLPIASASSTVAQTKPPKHPPPAFPPQPPVKPNPVVTTTKPLPPPLPPVKPTATVIDPGY